VNEMSNETQKRSMIRHATSTNRQPVAYVKAERWIRVEATTSREKERERERGRDGERGEREKERERER